MITEDGDLLCLDAKVVIDSNAIYRHADLSAMRDPSQEDEREAVAAKWDLNYVALDGNIGCMVNGAGLAMGTMDRQALRWRARKLFRRWRRSYQGTVAEAFKLILSDSNVNAVLVNIFGGIVRCDMIAEGIIGAVEEVGVEVPVVVRLEGTNADKGAEILDQSDLNIIAGSSLGDAAKKVVAAAGGAHEYPYRQTYQGYMPRIHGEEWHVPFGTSYSIRHPDGRRGHARKGGTEHLGLPVFDTVADAVTATGADASVIYVPAPFVMDSIMEAVGAGIRIIVCVTEGVPTLDMLKCKIACDNAGVVLIGPNCLHHA